MPIPVQMAVRAVGDQIHTVQVVTLRQCLDFHQLATARARDVPYIPATTFCGCSFLSEGDDRILWLDILTDDECRILKWHPARKLGGVIHCFYGSREIAEQYLKLGYHFGIV